MPAFDTPARTARAAGEITSGHSFLYICALVLLWALIYVPDMGSRPLMDDMDGLHAEAAKEMVEQHDFVTLHVNGIRYLEKAPLMYWLTAAGYAQFGFTELATRLPLSLLTLCAILAVFWLGREIAGDEAGLCSALVMASAVGPYIYTRFLIPDIIVCLWLTITAALLIRGFNQPGLSRRAGAALGLVTALDVLTKGLIGLVFPAAILACYLALTRDFALLRRLRLGIAAVVFFVVATPWHVLATLRNPPAGAAKGFFWLYFINEQVNRYLNKRVPHDYNQVPLLIFWGLVLIWLIPWTGYVIASLRQIAVPWRQIRTDKGRVGRASLLLLIWALVILVFFSFSSRQEYYVLPALPALAVLAGLWLAREAKSAAGTAIHRAGLRCAKISAVLGVVIGAVMLLLAAITKPLPAGMDFADALKKAPELYTLSLGHLFDLTPQAMGAFRGPLLLAGLSLLLGPAIAWYYRRRLFRLRANVALALMMAVMFYAVHLALVTFAPILGSKPLAAALQQQLQNDDVIVVDAEYSAASSIQFYTGRQLHPLNINNANLWFGSLFPDAPRVFENDSSFEKLWHGPQGVFFVTGDDHARDRLSRFQAPVFEVARSGGKTIFSNRALASR